MKPIYQFIVISVNLYKFHLNQILILLLMIRGVRQNKKQLQKLPRSRSRSPANTKVNALGQKLQKSPTNIYNTKNNKPNRSRSKSPQRSIDPKNQKKGQNKKQLKKSKSEKKLNKSLSMSKVDVGKKSLVIPKIQKRKKSASQINTIPINNNNLLMKSARTRPKQQTPKITRQISKQLTVAIIKPQEKEMGLIFLRPQSDKPLFKALEMTDDVFEKYHDMISNDNDTNYVTNALPELISMKKEDDTAGRDFVSGKIARLSGVFDNLTVDKVISWVRKVPMYYTGQCGKNLFTVRIILQTRFKVEVDVGFLLYSVDGDKVTIFRVYLSKIYRKMNYLGYVYIQMLKYLMGRHSGCDRWSMFILEKNVGVHKFFKYLGFKIEKIATQSKNKNVDYFQEFTIKRKQLNTALASMK